MKILIDRDELVRVFNSRRAFYCDEKPESFRRLDYSDKCRVDMLDSCIADAFNMPTYEAVYNQKAGHWILPKNDDGTSDIIEYQVRCSECGLVLDPQTYSELKMNNGINYCCQCGATMKGVEQ